MIAILLRICLYAGLVSVGFFIGTHTQGAPAFLVFLFGIVATILTTVIAFVLSGVFVNAQAAMIANAWMRENFNDDDGDDDGPEGDGPHDGGFGAFGPVGAAAAK